MSNDTGMGINMARVDAAEKKAEDEVPAHLRAIANNPLSGKLGENIDSYIHGKKTFAKMQALGDEALAQTARQAERSAAAADRAAVESAKASRKSGGGLTLNSSGMSGIGGAGGLKPMGRGIALGKPLDMTAKKEMPAVPKKQGLDMA